MPIQSYNPNTHTLTRKCAACSDVATLDATTLQLGSTKAKDAVLLPACTCGANETVFRTWDVCPENTVGSTFDKQRKCVNMVAKYLKDAGKSHPDHVAAHAAETTDSTDIPANLAALYSTGLLFAGYLRGVTHKKQKTAQLVRIAPFSYLWSSRSMVAPTASKPMIIARTAAFAALSPILSAYRFRSSNSESLSHTSIGVARVARFARLAPDALVRIVCVDLYRLDC